MALGMAGLVVLEISHVAWLDVCDPLFESPRTPLGFGVAIAASGIPVAYAVSQRSKPLVIASAIVAILELVVWWWLLAPIGVC